MKFGLQLFSVRDLSEQSFPTALRRVSELGYSFVETAGLYGHTPSEVARMAADCGLCIRSTHTPIDRVFEHLDEVIAEHKALGCADVVIPWADLTCAKAIDTFVENANRCIPILRKEGITLHYHNHSAELLKNPDGLVGMLEILKRTEIKIEPDLFWLCNAGIDPIAFMDEHRKRIAMVHLKDGIFATDILKDTHAGVEGRALGEGLVPIEELCRHAAALGFDMIVESEGLSPSGIEEVERSLRYIRPLFPAD